MASPLTRIAQAWRRHRLRRHAIDPALWSAVLARLPLLRALDPHEHALLREHATLFLADKVLSPSAGATLAAEQALEIAVWACLPVLHRGLGAYAGFRGIIVYPDEFLAPREEVDEAGVVHVGHEPVIGESWDAGPMLLSWADVEVARVPGNGCVVIHECAHKLDMGDGAMNGVPDLRGTGIATAEWAGTMEAAWHALERACETPAGSPIDDYALESPAEFFAVLSEEFFTDPALLHRHCPQAAALLARYYGIDTLRWVRARG